jgi:hypothetical protein
MKKEGYIVVVIILILIGIVFNDIRKSEILWSETMVEYPTLTHRDSIQDVVVYKYSLSNNSNNNFRENPNFSLLTLFNKTKCSVRAKSEWEEDGFRVGINEFISCGDSLIKAPNSSFVKVVKKNGSDYIFKLIE